MKWIRSVLALGLLLAGVQAASAEDFFWLGIPFQTEVRANGLYYENLFQAPDGEPKENVTGFQVEGRAETRLGASDAFKAYGRLSVSTFDSGLDPSETLGGGVRGGWQDHHFDAYAEFANDRPSIDLDVVDQADVGRLNTTYDYRGVQDWQFSGLGTVEQQRYAHAEDRDNRFWSLGGAVRYRGFGRRVSPEIGIAKGHRSVDSANESYDQDEYWLRVISEPIDALYLAVRYRVRQRDYTVGSSLASNHGRSDDRPQWSMVASYRTGAHLFWNLYWAREQSDSSRPGVDFTTQYLVAGAGWRF